MAISPAIIKLRSTTIGMDYVFEPEELPLISRRIDSQHLDDQGPSFRRINVTLNGFFYSNSLHENMLKYADLLSVLKSNEIKLTYTDGVNTIYDGMVWVDDYTDPSEWKQYKGTYSINLHYFETSDQPNADLGIIASYVSAGGTFTFNPPPLLDIGAKRTPYWRASDFTPSGLPITREGEIHLDGFMTAANHTALMGLRQQLFNACSMAGVLNYGAFSAYAPVVELKCPSVFPRLKCPFQMALKYNIGFGVRRLETSRSIPRVHNNPLIRERPQCGLPPDVRELGQSGQEIRFNFVIEGDDMPTLRAILATEASYAIYPGGIELPGGTQEESDAAMSISLNIVKFYPIPIIPNLAGT